MKKQKTHALIVSIFGASAIGIGAFGAHGLKQKYEAGLITLNQLNAFDTGARYQIYHSIALLLLIALSNRLVNKYYTYAFLSFVFGILFFSGSLYLLSTKDLLHLSWLSFLGPITPIGGLLFMLGWLFIGLGFKKEN
ncbi:MAG: DUF423 domain-containing protein [Bacteroidota bacterium]|jgi:uncharacterized membrane protein YgdD (TMEM256/DUF423 family)